MDGCFQVQLVVLREKYQAPQVILPLWVTHPRPKYRGTYDPYNGGHHHTKGGPKRSPSKATRQRIGAASRLVWERAGYREMQSKAHRKEEKS
ncbi:MAG TPA: hypothetical protein VKS44_15720 [Candidatus Acidoferrales bacterium]|nr:hypothetical protein [Candidatus Acidoferrales bacterium]